jgi:hypothetical protein
MSKAPLVLTAVIVEGRRQGEAARADGVAQGWSAGWWRATGLRGGGVRAPITASETSPTATSATTVELIIRLRKQLSEHPGRCPSDAAFAMLAGAAPIPASSGQTVRVRLNRSGAAASAMPPAAGMACRFQRSLIVVVVRTASSADQS